MSESFNHARGVIALLTISGWLTAGVGVILVVSKVQYVVGEVQNPETHLAAWLDVSLGVGAVVGGLTQIALALITRAVIVSARNSTRMVQMSQDQVRHAKESATEKPSWAE